MLHYSALYKFVIDIDKYLIRLTNLLVFNVYMVLTVFMCQDVTTHVYDGIDVLTLPVKRQFERVELSPEVIRFIHHYFYSFARPVI